MSYGLERLPRRPNALVLGVGDPKVLNQTNAAPLSVA